MERNVWISWLKSRRRQLYVYPAFLAVFSFAGWLYGNPSQVIFYCVLVSCATAFLMLVPDFFIYARREKELFSVKEQIMAELCELPVPEDLTEAHYQEMLTALYEKKLAVESGNAIRMREMMDYFGMWVHQIKTPIAALHVLLQAFREEELEEAGAAEVSQQKKRDLNRSMETELFLVEQYVEMALSYVRMEHMDSDLLLAPCEVEKIVRQAVRKYSRLFIGKQIRIEMGDLSGKILTDEKWCQLVIEQVLSNAIKYTKQGKVSIRMEGPALIIQDTGIGIRKEDLPRIFEKGFTGYNGHADKKSTGIGLYLCKMVLDRLGHQITVFSVPGEGTTVQLFFGRPKVDVRD